MTPAVSIIPTREPVSVEPRRPLTRAEFAQLLIDQGGKCGCGCGEKLNPLTEGVIDEHVLALTLGGPNALANRSIWRKPCSVKKTKGDRSADAKVKRLRGETCAGPSKPIPQRPGGGWPPKGSRKLSSRGFTPSRKGSDQ